MSEKSPSFDPTYLERRMERLERKLNMLLDFLESKKIIDESIRKMFAETKTSSEELLKWYTDELKKKQPIQ